MADEFVELGAIPGQTRKKKLGEFFGRMQRGYGKAKEIVQDYQKRREQDKFSKDIDRENAMERATIRAEREARFAGLQARRLTAQRKVYDAAAARNVAKGRYMGEIMRFPIDMTLRAVPMSQRQSPQPSQRVAYRSKSKGRKSKTRIRYDQQPQRSMDDQLVEWMRR